MGCEFFFDKWESNIVKLYSGLYGRGTSTESLRPGSVTMDPRWKWISMIDRLSVGDITKHDEIYQKNWIECLNLLSFWHEKDKYIEHLNKQQQLNSKYGK